MAEYQFVFSVEVVQNKSLGFITGIEVNIKKVKLTNDYHEPVDKLRFNIALYKRHIKEHMWKTL